MAKKIRSAKGDLVDFDLLKIKQQISSTPTPSDVKARQEFVDRKLRRKYRKTYKETENVSTVDVGKDIKNTSNEGDKIQQVGEQQTSDGSVSTSKTTNTTKSPSTKTAKSKQKARPKTTRTTRKRGQDET